MIYVDWACDKCANRIGMKDGWKPICKAFPDGIPVEMLNTDPAKLKECNNGIGFEPEKIDSND